MQITEAILKEIAPGGKQSNFKLFPMLADWMNYYFSRNNIDTNSELCHFLAQAAHETNSFNTLTEYDSGVAYEGRKDLGNINPGDGVKYKGRGIFQVTGLINYYGMDVALNEPGISFELHPELLANPQYAVWSACVYWNSRHLSDFASIPDTQTIFSKTLKQNITPLEYISWRINGSLKTVPERKIFYDRCKDIFK